MHDLVEAALGKDAENKVNSLIQDLFGSNPNMNLYITDQEEMVYATNDGEEVPVLDGSGNIIGSRIRLNVDAIAGSSQEYIAATIIHEALHSYFTATGFDMDHHQEMSDDYIETMQDILLDMFPSTLDANAAYALAFGGLKGTSWYVCNPNMDPLTLDAINVAYRAHDIYTDGKHLRIGTGCPN